MTAEKGEQMKTALLTGLAVIWATAGIAHSPLEMTEPADMAVVSEMPQDIKLDFKGDIRLTRVKLTHATSETTDLDLDGFEGFTSEYAIPVPAMGGGDYVVEWRGLGDDGHPLNGTFSFVVEE